MPLWAVLMAGGSGTRFWPESREGLPKQFLGIFGRKTLLEETSGRLLPLIPKSRWLAVTQAKQVARVKKLLKVKSSQVVGEPVGRNTAPCAALAAGLIQKKDPKAVLALLPTDHRIANAASFRKALALASRLAFETGLPVTFGMRPKFPHTGYGYLELASRRGQTLFGKKASDPFWVKQFHEKPNLQKARRFVRSRRFLWNSGIFVWRADKLLEATQRYLPRLYSVVLKISPACHSEESAFGGRRRISKQRSFVRQNSRTQDDITAGMKRFYSKSPNISIDCGLMEKMKGRILALAADFDWQDLGGWKAFGELCPMDRRKNAAKGKALFVKSTGNIVKTGRRLVALVGMKDAVVIDTKDVLLVCPKDQTESVREIVRLLKQKKWHEYL